MSGYNVNGERLEDDYVLVGAVLDASSNNNNYLAMKQLLDIGKKRLKNPNATITSAEFDKATAGIVCCMPKYNPALYDGYPFEILYSKNPTVQHGPASVTKILTISTGLPYVSDLSDRITFIADDIKPGSGAIFEAGDIVTIRDLLFAIMFWSSNTAAFAFARYVGARLLNDQSASPADCVATFVAEMNRVATGIGCSGSSFDSPSGYSVTNLTTVSDLMKITIHASSFRELDDVWNKTTYTINILGDNPRTETGTFSVTTNSTINADYSVFGGKPGSLTLDGNVFNGLAMIAKPKTP